MRTMIQIWAAGLPRFASCVLLNAADSTLVTDGKLNAVIIAADEPHAKLACGCQECVFYDLGAASAVVSPPKGLVAVPCFPVRSRG
jgi:hypothetical protein